MLNERITTAISRSTPASLFPEEFGWIDGKRSQGWNGGRCNAKQRHGQHRADDDYRISRIRLIHNLPQ
jgi:hypothetical protein